MRNQRRPISAVTSFVAGLLIYGLAAMLGLVLLALLFWLGVLNGIEILFYRGIVLSIGASFLAAVVGWMVLRWLDGASAREIVALLALSFGINLTFMVLGPVTVDRSISVFMLGVMDKEPNRSWPVSALEERFRSIYVGDYQQIGRRIAEQSTSGNVVARGDGYVITARGRAFVSTAKMIGHIFQTDMKFVDPIVPGTQPSGDGAAIKRP